MYQRFGALQDSSPGSKIVNVSVGCCYTPGILSDSLIIVGGAQNDEIIKCRSLAKKINIPFLFLKKIYLKWIKEISGPSQFGQKF